MTYCRSGGGGAIFSVASLNWFCSLGGNYFENNVAELPGNALRELVRQHS